MELYLNNYDILTKKIVYDFRLGDGGIGDLTKYFMYTLFLGIKYNIKIHYLVNNIIIEKYLKLKYPKMYITSEEIGENKHIINNINDLQNIKSDIFYVITPYVMYGSFREEFLQTPLQEIFYFSDEIILNAKSISTNNYISVHLRMGDKYLETDVSFIRCKDDVRQFNEEHLFNFIERNYDKNIMFFSDNRKYKIRVKKLYNKIIITDYDIGHSSLKNTSDKQILDSVTEFYLMTNSECIYTASSSGFSLLASKFKNIPITMVPDNRSTMVPDNKSSMVPDNKSTMIYIYGDSHARFSFHNVGLDYKDFHRSAVTMFRIGRDNIIVNFDKNMILGENDIIVLSYGEIDCRCHIQRQINNGRDEDDIINELVDKYFLTIRNNIQKKCKIIIVGIIPPTKQNDYEILHGPILHEFPFLGKDEDRVRYTNKVNKKLKEHSNLNNYIYFNPYSYYTRQDGTLKHELSDTNVHLGNNSHFLEKFYDCYKSAF